MAERKARLPRILPAGSRRKVTLSLRVETDIRLDHWAKKRGVSRSELADLILDGELDDVHVERSRPASGQAGSAA